MTFALLPLLTRLDHSAHYHYRIKVEAELMAVTHGLLKLDMSLTMPYVANHLNQF